jgi:hypothetical protein
MHKDVTFLEGLRNLLLMLGVYAGSVCAAIIITRPDKPKRRNCR